MPTWRPSRAISLLERRDIGEARRALAALRDEKEVAGALRETAPGLFGLRWPIAIVVAALAVALGLALRRAPSTDGDGAGAAAQKLDWKATQVTSSASVLQPSWNVTIKMTVQSTGSVKAPPVLSTIVVSTDAAGTAARSGSAH